MTTLTQEIFSNSLHQTICSFIKQSARALVEIIHFPEKVLSKSDQYRTVTKTSIIVLLKLSIFSKCISEKVLNTFNQAFASSNNGLLTSIFYQSQIDTIKNKSRQTENVSLLYNLILRDSFTRLIYTFK